MKKRVFNGESKIWLVICSVAMLCGFISFFVTVRLYDANPHNKLSNTVDIKKAEPFIVKAKVQPQVIETKKEMVQEIKNDLQEEPQEQTQEEVKKDETVEPVLVLNEELPIENDMEVLETMSTVVEKNEMPKEEMIEFEQPVNGQYGMEYAEETLIFSKTLNEWIVHPAIDIIAEEAEPVKAIAEGVITEIKMDPRYGNTIMINHGQGYRSLYANLSTTDLVYVGKNVKQGEIISEI